MTPYLTQHNSEHPRIALYNEFMRQLDLKQPIGTILLNINDWFNTNITYTPDAPNKDHYQTLEETLTRGKGDCEDKHISIWATLRNCHIRAHLFYVEKETHAHMALMCSNFIIDGFVSTIEQYPHKIAHYWDENNLIAGNQIQNARKHNQKWHNVLTQMNIQEGIT